MNTALDALRALPDDAGMIEYNPDEGMRLFCCGGDVVCYLGARDDTVKHRADCWHVAARATIARHDAAPLQAATADFLAALAAHRATLDSAEDRRAIDRLAGNVRKVGGVPCAVSS